MDSYSGMQDIASVWIIIMVKSVCQDQLWEVKWKIKLGRKVRFLNTPTHQGIDGVKQ